MPPTNGKGNALLFPIKNETESQHHRILQNICAICMEFIRAFHHTSGPSWICWNIPFVE